jgi:hypothetical protein
MESSVEGKYKYIAVKIQENWNSMAAADFWTAMLQNGYIWPVDEKGNEPLKYLLLPTSLSLTVNDPYRTLSYLVRQVGGFKKTTTYVATELAQSATRRSG